MAGHTDTIAALKVHTLAYHEGGAMAWRVAPVSAMLELNQSDPESVSMRNREQLASMKDQQGHLYSELLPNQIDADSGKSSKVKRSERPAATGSGARANDSNECCVITARSALSCTGQGQIRASQVVGIAAI